MPSRIAFSDQSTHDKAASENFPVASWLLGARMRRPILAFYHFARTADDIADNPKLTPLDKHKQLDALQYALDGHKGAMAGYELWAATQGQKHLLAHAHQLLRAFRQDIVQMHYASWGDLLAYCQNSAAPVGRFMLDLYGQDSRTFAASDALCAALQILNHIQDCVTDRQTLGRVYIPQDWLALHKLNHDSLLEPAPPPALTRVLAMMLDQVEQLLIQAAPLLGQIRHPRLAWEIAVIYTIAADLTRLLRRSDPIRSRVGLSRWQYAVAFAKGMYQGMVRRS